MSDNRVLRSFDSPAVEETSPSEHSIFQPTAGEEVQPCLAAAPSLRGSSQEKQPDHPKLARNIVDNLGSSTFALATGLLSIYFLLFAALAFHNDNAVLEPGSQAAWLLVAAKYVRPATQKTFDVTPANIHARDLRCSPSCLRQSWGSS
jgi:hypothetical protein